VRFRGLVDQDEDGVVVAEVPYLALGQNHLAIRGIDGQIGHGDTIHNHPHPDPKAGLVLAFGA